MKHLRYAAAIPALLLAAPAFAGNLEEPVVEPVIAQPVQVQPISDWTGFYLGAQAGYGKASSINADANSLLDLTHDAFSLKPDGGLGGVHAGYLYDLGQWVVGGELDYDWAGIKDSASVAGIDPVTEEDAVGDVEVKIKNIARAKAIVGYDLGDGLLYGTAGAFRAKAEASTPFGSESKSKNGWMAGIGYKHKFTENWIGGVEALYHKKSNFAGLEGVNSDLKLTTITARISYKF